MNYWHMQLHPNNTTTHPVKVVVDILRQKAVIGLGEWDDGEKQKDIFFRLIHQDFMTPLF